MYQEVGLSQSRRKVLLKGGFEGYPVQHQRGALVADYLKIISRVIETSLKDYPRTFSFRVDVKLPEGHSVHIYDRLMEKFIASFRKKVEQNRVRAQKAHKRVATSRVRYVWALEYTKNGLAHYHLMLFMNHDAFFTLGTFEIGRDNLYNKIVEAWASALGVTIADAVGLVNIPNNATYKILFRDYDTIAPAFNRASYLAKVETKQYGLGVRSFGASQK